MVALATVVAEKETRRFLGVKRRQPAWVLVGTCTNPPLKGGEFKVRHYLMVASERPRRWNSTCDRREPVPGEIEAARR